MRFSVNGVVLFHPLFAGPSRGLVDVGACFTAELINLVDFSITFRILHLFYTDGDCGYVSHRRRVDFLCTLVARKSIFMFVNDLSLPQTHIPPSIRPFLACVPYVDRWKGHVDMGGGGNCSR